MASFLPCIWSSNILPATRGSWSHRVVIALDPFKALDWLSQSPFLLAEKPSSQSCWRVYLWSFGRSWCFIRCQHHKELRSTDTFFELSPNFASKCVLWPLPLLQVHRSHGFASLSDVKSHPRHCFAVEFSHDKKPGQQKRVAELVISCYVLYQIHYLSQLTS